MTKHLLLTTVAASLMLAGCDASSDQETETSDSEATVVAGDGTEPAIASEQADTPFIEKERSIDSFSIEDKDKIRHYGKCSSILKAMVYSINKQNLHSDSTMEIVRNSFAHQATIYTILNVESINKYPEHLRDEAIAISNEFMNKNIMNNTLNLKQLSEMNKSECDFKNVTDEAGRIMKENSSFYEEENQNIKYLGIS